MKVLVAGCFSIEGGSATAGDLLAAEIVCDWLDQAGVQYDISVIPPFKGGIDWRRAGRDDYTHAVFVCGPFGRDSVRAAFLTRFANCRTVGINLTMLEPLDRWNPFDVLFERDSSARARPDISFLSRRALVPVVGVCLVEPYGTPFEAAAVAAIQRLIEARPMSVVEIDTRLDGTGRGFRSPAEIESVLARMDMVITTRLHGTVLSLKNGVPALAIDAGGAGLKVTRQAETVGWPVVFRADELSDEALVKAFEFCLTEEARTRARECSERAATMLKGLRDEFIAGLALTNVPTHQSSGENIETVRISSNVTHLLTWQEVTRKKATPLQKLKTVLRTLGRATRLIGG